jgi:hypothetical protein
VLSAAFGGRGKKRLNRVFDAIGFVYPDYRYPLRGQGKKRKTAASAAPVEPVPKGKKMKVLTHRPRYIESVVVPEFGEGASSAAETRVTASARSTKEPVVMPKVLTVKLVETKADKADGPKVKEMTKMSEILSPSTEATVPKAQRGSAATPKRRRMANVLDVVLETTKTLSPAPTRKIAEASKAQPEAETKQAEVEAATIQAETEAGPSVPTKMERADPKEKSTEQIATGETEALGPEASDKSIDYIIHHASGKVLSPEEILEAQH